MIHTSASLRSTLYLVMSYAFAEHIKLSECITIFLVVNNTVTIIVRFGAH